MNFRFTLEHLLTSIIGIFPKNILIIEIFFKNPGNWGNFYSIVNLHFFPLLKKFIVDQQSFKKHKSNLSTKYNRPKPQFSHRSPILGIPPPRFWPLCPSIFYAAHAKERWHHHHLEDLSNSTSTRSDGLMGLSIGSDSAKDLSFFRGLDILRRIQDCYGVKIRGSLQGFQNSAEGLLNH